MPAINVQAIDPYASKTCSECGKSLPLTQFSRTHSIFFKDGFLPICNKCITALIRNRKFEWSYIDKICQFADIPWIPKEWERIKELSGDEHVWSSYTRIFAGNQYANFGWGEYNK